MTVSYNWILAVWLVLESVTFNQARHSAGVEGTDDQYFYLDSVSDTYHYGYEVNPNGTFHHERRGPEGVTYGCYGYIDSNQKQHVTHYVADQKGYRVVEPNKPILIYLSEQTAWQAFLLPRGCRSHTGKPSSTGPELIYKPLGAVSTPSKPATSTTRRPTTTATSATCNCVWPTLTKPTVLTPKPPTTTKNGSTMVSKATSTTTARTTPVSTTTPSKTTTPKTTQSTMKPDRLNVGIATNTIIGRPTNYIYRPQYEEHPNLGRDPRAQKPSSPQIYYVPYHQNTAPPGVPSKSHGTCGSGFGYIGLAPVIFVPAASAKNVGLEINASQFRRSDIPLRMFTKPIDGGNWTATEMLDDDGNHFGLSHSEELKKIVNGVDFDLLVSGDSVL
ncbi:uncharacterized protein LOC135697672 [Ochlerotatus camptorhynchus]|uniref:uncharacterized protein LOC135697672 n=1 Tax=Ochlerotatus camptorhynchus TaxID=644619 RepID=UPI0031D6D8A1